MEKNLVEQYKKILSENHGWSVNEILDEIRKTNISYSLLPHISEPSPRNIPQSKPSTVSNFICHPNSMILVNIFMASSVVVILISSSLSHCFI